MGSNSSSSPIYDKSGNDSNGKNGEYDEKLFKQPPPAYGDCPICFLQLPYLTTGSKYMACCGKTICGGCYHSPVYDNQGNEVDNQKCPYCRTPWPSSDEELNEMEKKRMEAGDAEAFHNIGCDIYHGRNGYQRDYTKALELWHRAAELGYDNAYNSIGYAYDHGQGVEVDKKKAIHCYELAAIGGDLDARRNLGAYEENEGNMDRAIKHYMIAVRGGYDEPLKQIQQLYTNGHATKDDYTKALKAYQTYLGEIKSPQRDEAAAADERHRYY